MDSSKKHTRGTTPISDFAARIFDNLTSTQASRTGHTAARIASALGDGVAPEVLALQLTINSKKNNPNSPVTFTAADMLLIKKLYDANKSRPAITRAQTSALILEHKHDEDGNEGLVALA